MPMRMEWEPPEFFVHTKAGDVYHAYGDGDADHRLSCWFTTDSSVDEEGWTFDIRELPSFAELSTKFVGDTEAILKEAAKRGELKFPPEEDND